MTDKVKYIHSSMPGAPVMTNQWGDLTTMLTAALVTGFNLKSVTSIERVGFVVTVTLGSGHGFLEKQVLLFSGADQAEYNGEHRLDSVTATTLVFTITTAPATPATTASSFQVKTAPLGFELAFSATNKAVYRSPNILGNRAFLRVDDSLDPLYTTTYAKWAKVTIAENMTDVDTFAGKRAPYDPAAPTKNEVATGSGATVVNGWYKWVHSYAAGNTAASTLDSNTQAKEWLVVGDDRGFYLFINFAPTSLTTNYGRVAYCFNEIKSYKAGDAYKTLLTASEIYTAANAAQFNYVQERSELYWQNLPVGKVMMTDYSQIGNPIRVSTSSLSYGQGVASPSGTESMIPFPNGPGNNLLVNPVFLREEIVGGAAGSGGIRGELPGLYYLPQARPYSDLTAFNAVTNYPGRRFMLVDGGYQNTMSAMARVAVDITGPWDRQ